ncbi:MAG: aromatic-ring-hydroxylating dioxygenase subunit beta [Burkholderiales bacterium]
MTPVSETIEREVARLIAREAYCLDRKLWREWLTLYAEDAEFWAPAWASEEALTNDPGNELSMIYIRGRAGLEDRVYRIEARDSLATAPMDRTAHVVGSILVHSAGEQIIASASWITHIYGIHGVATLGGYSDYSLRRVASELRIAKKRVVLIDDRLEVPVDIYHL